ncbi:EAL domain-containing protein [Parasulfuritortus cantonensis]|uniref:EAL domain-containing protein n=1 Tax=Parasulfuritortus cantonensis TaxID=2528202 RepID=A0A4R1B6Q6_9PROT|nr:EAL domain-containing protein [Parasulfuritortus cantonensis]TCJ11685.1 EAL domain-containing protein [Parasulfuritortus cantonensis]
MAETRPDESAAPDGGAVRLAAVLAALRDGVITADARGCIQSLNPAAERLTGWPAAEALGRPVAEVFRLVGRANRVSLPGPVAEVLASGAATAPTEHTLLNLRTGTELAIVCHAVPLAGPDGGAGALLVFRDRTGERDELERLRESERQLNTILDNVESYIFIKDTDYRYRYANRAVCRLFGADLADIVGRTDADFLDPDALARLHANDRRVIEDGERLVEEEELIGRATGEHCTALTVKLPLRHPDGRIYALCGVATDITWQKRREDQLRLAAGVFDHAQEGILITDADARIVDINPAFTAITGYGRDEALGRNPSFLKSDHHAPEFFADMWASVLETGAWRGEVCNRKKNGESFIEMLAISAVPARQGGRGYFVGVFTDITQFKAQQQRLERIAHYDALTQLPNRVLMADRLHVALAQTRRAGDLMAVCYLDLDEFKPVNDTYGHEAGDQILVEVASRLSLGLRAGDTVARLGGDEFVILLAGLHDLDECRRTLDRLLRTLAKPYGLAGGVGVELSASVGVAVYPLDDTDADTLLRHADQSMYVAKEAGRNRYHLYDPEHDRRARAQREAISRIEEGLLRGEFQLHYQPKVDMRRGRVVGAEALIRWQHPQRGLLPPSEFLPHIDGTELARPVGEWVIDTALAQMAAWRKGGLELPVSVNVSARHLQSPDFTDNLARALARQPGVPPSDLELEILETSALDDLLHVAGLIDGCHRLGVSFALDDFGTGYSSLSYLKRLSAKTLKIDQSFVRDMLHDSEDMAIVDAIVGMAEAFQRRVIAEGVEGVEHGVLLLHLGCDCAQGYAIARPMAAAEIPAWVANWRPDGAWLQAARQHCPKADLPILIAGFDHRHWIDLVAAWIGGAGVAANPPPLNSHACRFGRWYDGPGLARYGALAAFREIGPVHERIHALVRELATLKLAGQDDRAAGRVPELLDQRNSLLLLLERLAREIAARAD